MTKSASILPGNAAARLFCAIACFLLFALAAYGQGDRGSVTGTITDPSGGVTPNASIDVKNVDTGAVFHGGASGTGNYVIPLPAGKYQMTVTVPGFKKYVRENVQVQVASATRQDIVLELGAVNDTVTITDVAPLMKTESGEISHTVTTDEVNQLPVLTIAGGSWFGATGMGNIRNPLQESILLPGVAFSNDQALVVNGMPSNSETIRIDGQESTSTIWKVLQQNSQGSVDAIQEVAVQTSNFAAEYGQAAGGYFNYTMKSGTNQLHGSAYDFFVNEFLNAGLPFTDRCTQSGVYCVAPQDRQHIRNSVRRNDYGFTFGGPVVIPKIYNGKNKTFFFVNFEQFRQNNIVSNGLATVPTQAYRGGDFSLAGCQFQSGGVCVGQPPAIQTVAGQPAVDPAGNVLALGEIFNPYSTTLVGGQQVRTPFQNQTIPLSLMDPVSLNVQKLLPSCNVCGNGTNNYNIPAYTNFQHTTNVSVKMDQAISSTIKISGYYSQLETFSPNANGFDPILGAVPTDTWNHTVRLNYEQTISPTLLLHIGIGYFDTSEPHIPAVFDQSQIGLKGYYDTMLMPDLGGLAYSFFTPAGGPNGGYSNAIGGTFSAELWEQKPTANTSLTWIRGNHTYKAGGEYVQEGYPNRSNWRANGNFTFAAAETSDPWQNGQLFNINNPTGFNYASFLLGLPDSESLNPPTSTKLGYHSMGFFVQDSWKVTRKLTVNYGLRYDYETYMKEQYGRMQDASFVTPNSSAGGRNGAVIYEATCHCSFTHNYPYAFGPRLGFAYQIDSKTVLRGGAGVQYDAEEAPNGVSYSTADFYTVNPPGYGVSPLQQSGGLAGGNQFAPGNPYGNPPIVWPNFNESKYPVYNGATGTAPPLSPFVYFDPNNRPGRVVTWSVGVQREVMRNLVAEVSYVGNRGAYFPAPSLDQAACNCITPQILTGYGININNPADRALLTDQLSNPAVIARFPQFANPNNVYPGFPASQTLAQALRPVPQWTGVLPWLGPPLGQTWYDSMQVKVTKRYSRGLQSAGELHMGQRARKRIQLRQHLLPSRCRSRE